MAGSYEHLINGNGKFTFDKIENMGDAYEACEDCFKIIQKLKSHNKNYAVQPVALPKLPSLDLVLKQFDFGRDQPVSRAKQVGAITQVYDIIKRVGNFA